MRTSLPIFGLIALVLVGCGGSPAKVAVRGKVTFRGQPLKDGTVMFVAQGAGVTAAGTIQPDGSYELHSGKPGEGITPGLYKVAITPGYYDPTTGTPPRFAARYVDPDTSGLQAEVKQGAGSFDFDLKDARN
jgi:hypothetical protein